MSTIATDTRGTEAILAFRRRFFRRAFERTGRVGFPAASGETVPDLATTAFVLPEASYCLEPDELQRVVSWMLSHQAPSGAMADRPPSATGARRGSGSTTTQALLTAFCHRSLVALQLRGMRNERWTRARRQTAGWLASLAGSHAPSSDVSAVELGAIAHVLAVVVGAQHAPLLYRSLDGLVATLSHRPASESSAPARLWLARGLLGVFHELGSRGHLDQVAGTLQSVAEHEEALDPGHAALLVRLVCDVDRAEWIRDHVDRLGHALDADGVVVQPTVAASPGDPLALDTCASALAHEALCRYAGLCEGKTQIPIWVRMEDGGLQFARRCDERPAARAPGAGPETSSRRDTVRAVFLPHEPVGQACPYLRVHAPLSRLDGRSHVVYEQGADPVRGYTLISTAAFERADVIVFQRLFPAWLVGQVTLPRVERTGAAVVYDLDDDFFEMPHDHPKRSAILPALPELRRALVTADVVTAPTEALARKLTSLGARSALTIPNAVDPKDWPAEPPAQRADGPIVLGCVGTSTHAGDYDLISGVLCDLLRAYDGRVEMVIWGDAPSQLVSHPLVSVDPHYVSSYRDYAHKLATGGIHIGLVPLARNPFNAAKSAIKWLELSAAGIPGIFTRSGQYAEWVRDGADGLLVEDDPNAWREAIDALVQNTDRRREIARQAFERVRREHTVDASAALWLRAVDEARQARRRRRLEEIGDARSARAVTNPIRIPLAELVTS